MTEYKKQFLELYNTGLLDTELAIILNKPVYAITGYRAKNNLPNNRKAAFIDEEKVKQLHSKNYRIKQIADELNVPITSLKRVLKKLNLKTHFPSVNEYVELTQEQKEVLVGTVLGDAYLRTSGNNYNGGIQHSIKQKEYLIYKYEVLRNISSELTEREASRQFKGKDYISHSKIISFSLRSNQALRYFYDEFYSTGKKEVSDNLLQFLTPRAIAIWYMDDGTYAKGSLSLCTDSFSLETLNRLISFFKAKYEIICHISSRNRLYFDAITRNKFIELIRPYIHWSMIYKLDSNMTVAQQLEYNKQQENNKQLK